MFKWIITHFRYHVTYILRVQFKIKKQLAIVIGSGVLSNLNWCVGNVIRLKVIGRKMFPKFYGHFGT